MNIYGAEILSQEPMMGIFSAVFFSFLIIAIVSLPVGIIWGIIKTSFNIDSKIGSFIQSTICFAVSCCVVESVFAYTEMYEYKVQVSNNVSVESFIAKNSDNFEMQLVDNKNNIWELKERR